jgi:preprotein translocase subunit SecE
MANEKNTAATGSFWNELFQFGVYKRSQGRIARQVTFFVLVVLFVVGCWRLSIYFNPNWLLGWTGLVFSDAASDAIRFGTAFTVLAVGVWFSFRLVNMPRFADFLIAVEAEMNKVSWPTRTELFRSSMVVIVLLLLLTAVLFVYDIVWRFLFHWLGILG